MKKIYLDHAATTAVDADVLAAMIPYFSGVFGNPNSVHGFGQAAAAAVAEARDKTAKLIGCKPNEIYFTSGGTEADNWAIKGIARAAAPDKKKIITSAVEHHAVLNACKQMEKESFTVVYLPVDKTGRVDTDALKKEADDRTALVSVMYANNEIGTVQPVADIAALCRERGIPFHTDAVQAAGTLDIDVKRDGIDLLSLSAHKFYGPKGIGVLYIRSGLKIDKLISGGAQERSHRGGTTPVPLVVGLSVALERAVQGRQMNNARIAAVRDYFMHRVLTEVPNVFVNGGMENRLPGNASFCFEFIEGEGLLLMLDMAGVAVSSGSACASGSLETSHVLSAIGVPVETAQSATRFSFGKESTEADADAAVEALKTSVARLREMSPLFKPQPGPAKLV